MKKSKKTDAPGAMKKADCERLQADVAKEEPDYMAQIETHLDACESARDEVPHLLRALLASTLAILEKLCPETKR